MKVTIGTTTYTALKSLKFDPTADVTGNSVPVNEFSCDIKTTDSISAGQYADLYDDLDTLWAHYWIVYADRMDETTVRIQAQSSLRILERRMMDAAMYSAKSVSDAIAEIFSEIGVSAYTIDASFTAMTLTGFVPVQSAKNRLQWICFVIGAYIKSFFSETIDILPISDTPTLIPADITYWKPSLIYREFVTSVKATSYSYTQGTPAATDKWVTDGTNYYIQEQQSNSLANPDLPSGTLTHEVNIDGITLINEDNVDEVLSRLSLYHFKRLSVNAEIINNGTYLPGNFSQLYTSEHTIISGYIEKADFAFGVQAKSRISIAPVEMVGTGTITVIYTYGDVILDTVNYTFPMGYLYTISCKYFDQVWQGVRYIFRPSQETISGEITQDAEEITVQCVPALEYEDEILHIISVDGVSQTEGVVTIE